MKKGFTLIELLAVIVILAIIALIATPIILGIINDAREESNERSVELYASAVKNGIVAHQLRTGDEVLPGTYNESNPLPFEPDYEGNVKCTNVIISDDGKVSLDKCTVNGGTKEYSYGIEEGETPAQPVAKVCTIEKQDASKYSKGDVVTCNISETPDKFYVIEEQPLTATTIQMLTEKNIHATWYRQSDETETIAFSSINYWVEEPRIYDSNLLSKYGNSYPVDIYDENSDIVKPVVDEYVSYLNTKLIGSTGSLLTYSQTQNLGCDFTSNNCSAAPSWVLSTSYWIGVAFDNLYPYFVDSEESYLGMYDYSGGGYAAAVNAGVRPVITISTAQIQ